MWEVVAGKAQNNGHTHMLLSGNVTEDMKTEGRRESILSYHIYIEYT